MSNGFRSVASGHHPPRAAGSFDEQTQQLAVTTQLMKDTWAARLTPWKANASASQRLESLDVSGLTAGTPVSVIDYRSALPGVPPEEAYGYFRDHPLELFRAARLELHPDIGTLDSGERVMLEDRKTPVAPWAPIEFVLEPEQLQADLLTLDGHPFRGINRFTFLADGQGGTTVWQHSEFQGSSRLAEEAYERMGGDKRQTDIWRSVHQELFDALVKPRT